MSIPVAAEAWGIDPENLDPVPQGWLGKIESLCGNGLVAAGLAQDRADLHKLGHNSAVGPVRVAAPSLSNQATILVPFRVPEDIDRDRPECERSRGICPEKYLLLFPLVPLDFPSSDPGYQGMHSQDRRTQSQSTNG